MSTLAEIEAAVPHLTVEELERLESQLRELRQQRTAGQERPMTSLMRFSGVLRLAEDPSEWQRRIREEWE